MSKLPALSPEHRGVKDRQLLRGRRKVLLLLLLPLLPPPLLLLLVIIVLRRLDAQLREVINIYKYLAKLA